MRNTLLLFSILTYSTLFGQNWDFKPSLINNGLLQNSITGIQKDDRGFIWICTQFGIYRYDGANIINYTSGKKTKIESNRFSYIVEDENSKKLIAVDEKKEYQIFNGNITPIQNNEKSVCITNLGAIHYLDQVRLINWKKNAKRLGSANMYLFEKDTLIQHETELYNITKQTLISNAQSKILLEGFVVNYLNKVWLINKKGIYQVRFLNNNFTFEKKYDLIGNKNFAQIKNQFCWLQNNSDLIKFDLINNRVEYQISLTEFGIKNASSCFEDKEKMYIGTPSQGIFESYIFKGSRIKMQDIKSNENYLYSYAIDDQNNYYSTNSFGLFIKRANQNTSVNIFKHKLSSTVLDIYKCNLWAAALNRDIIHYNICNRKVRKIRLLNEDIKKIEQVNDSIVYITGEKGIYKYYTNTNAIHAIFHSKKGESILTSVFYLNQWYIGTDNGLIIYHERSKKQLHYLNKEYLRCVLPFDTSTVVLGTYSSGTYILKDNTIYPLNNDPSMVSKAVVALSKDSQNNLWVLCNKGAFFWEKAKVENIKNNYTNAQYNNFLETNGIIPAYELNGGQLPSSFPNNQIILPTSNGLVLYKKQDIIHKDPWPTINLRDIQVDGKDISIQSPINIDPSHHEIKISIDFPYFETENNFNVQYRIKGLYNEWKKLNSNRLIVLNTLQHGRYTIELKFNEKQAPIIVCNLEILPFWYNTLLFYISIFIFIILLFYLLIKLRTRYLKIKQVELEKIIHQKTQQLQVNIKNLSESEKEVTKLYKHSNKLYSILMHDLKSPLQFLSNYSISAFKNVKNNKEIEKETLKNIAGTSAELFKFINEFLFWLQKQNKKQEAVISKINLGEEINEVVHLYESICSLNNNKLVYFPKANPILIQSDPEMIKIIFRNLLDNANKYTQNGVIKISFEFTEHPRQVSIIIQDSGTGLPEHVIALLKEEHHAEKFSPSINANHKMGIQITKEFIQFLNGSLELVNSDRNGTIFKMHLPLT